MIQNESFVDLGKLHSLNCLIINEKVKLSRHFLPLYDNVRRSPCPKYRLVLQESVDTPIVERRKSSNWFTRQISRMGSVRSASTAYSSGGLFTRHRGNSVYASPEAGRMPQQPKMSIYDRLVGRKSGRNQRLVKQDEQVITWEVQSRVISFF